MINQFRLQIIYNSVRRWFNNVFYGTHYIRYDETTILFLEAALESIYGVDLHRPQHEHGKVDLKRFFVNFLIEQTGWSVMELSRQFETAGLTAKGLSRRSLQYYVNTHDEELNTPKGVEYGHEYFAFTQTLISIL